MDKTNFFGVNYYLYYCNTMIKRLLWVALSLFSANIILAQSIDPELQIRAKRGNEEAMYQVALALDKNANAVSYKEAFSLALKAAEKNYAPAQALVAYHYFKGFGIPQNLGLARDWASKAVVANHDGLAYWILQQAYRESQAFYSYVHEAFMSNYPLATLFYAKLFYQGSESFSVAKDEAKSKEFLYEVSKYNFPYSAAVLGTKIRKEGGNEKKAFEYLKTASSLGIPQVYSQLANMYFHGVGTSKDEKTAFEYYGKAAEKGDPLGMEGLADFYRMGLVVAQDQKKALDLYQKVYGQSPRASYLLACYLNEGVGTDKDEAEALSLFEKSAAAGYVFAQSYLGIALFTGSSPCREKDTNRASEYLLSVIAHPDFEDLPVEMKSKVYEYAAACLRYGVGAPMDVAKADELMDKASDLKSGLSMTLTPFGFVGPVSSTEASAAVPLITPADIPDAILDFTVLDYPKDLPRRVQDKVQAEDLAYSDNTLSFVDENLKNELVDYYDKSGDGELSEDELAAVVTLNGLKLKNTITSFDEFVYFSSIEVIPQLFFQGFGKMTCIALPESVNTIGNNAFLGCASLLRITLSPAVTTIGDWAFANCDNLHSIVCPAVDPPSIGENILSHTNEVIIYVPSESVDRYKKSDGWREYARRIKPIRN